MRPCLWPYAAVSLIACGNVSYCMRPVSLTVCGHISNCMRQCVSLSAAMSLTVAATSLTVCGHVPYCMRPCLLLYAAMSLSVTDMLLYCMQACFLTVSIYSECKQHGSSMISSHACSWTVYASMSSRLCELNRPA
jgi:hypothetical protein